MRSKPLHMYWGSVPSVYFRRYLRVQGKIHASCAPRVHGARCVAIRSRCITRRLLRRQQRRWCRDMRPRAIASQCDCVRACMRMRGYGACPRRPLRHAHARDRCVACSLPATHAAHEQLAEAAGDAPNHDVVRVDIKRSACSGSIGCVNLWVSFMCRLDWCLRGVSVIASVSALEALVLRARISLVRAALLTAVE